MKNAYSVPSDEQIERMSFSQINSLISDVLNTAQKVMWEKCVPTKIRTLKLLCLLQNWCGGVLLILRTISRNALAAPL